MIASKANRRRSARATKNLILVAAAIGFGACAGYWLPRQLGGRDAGVSTADTLAEVNGDVWFTCGMHPNVLQKDPGDCPICQMKLTPLRTGDSESEGETGIVERQIVYWRAPMDPNYTATKPGKSPMGMDLVPVYADASESSSAHTIQIDPVTIQNMGIRTATLGRGPLIKTIRTVGRIDYDEQHVTFVDTKFNGWIERLYVNETGQPVQEGEPLFDVYSRELFGAQNEYLSAIQMLPRLKDNTFAPAREEAVKMIEAAVTKLRYFDLSDKQIEGIREAGKTVKALPIESPATGIVTEKMALEGMYVKPGMRLYTIADLSRVWVYVDIYEYQLPWIRVGQQANMSLPYVPGRTFTGKVVYVYPYLERQSRVVRVRLEFANESLELKPGMFANVTLESELQRDALLIPREAYIDSGVRRVAFVSLGDGKFAPRAIQVGVEVESGLVEVLHGLDEGEVVVTSGQFLLDAESKLKDAVAKMMAIERTSTTRRVTDSVGDQPDRNDGQSNGIPTDAAFACPMDKHPDETDPANQGAYFAADAGRCPHCGMNLKPIESLEWVNLRRAAAGGDIAYTCPDHQHIYSDESGECPQCGKGLQAFRAMYTCPDAQHANGVFLKSGNCSRCGRGLATFRGEWLDETLAATIEPPTPVPTELAAYRCTIHPMVHSERHGDCTICGMPLADMTAHAAAAPTGQTIPDGAAFTCPMKECWQFSPTKAECPTCGMRLKPLEELSWTRELTAAAKDARFLCPMHPQLAHSTKPGVCSDCGMQLIAASEFEQPQGAAALVAAQMNYIIEHYLAIQRLLASDRTAAVATQALGLAAASEGLITHLDQPSVAATGDAKSAARTLHAEALKLRGDSLQSDRATFAGISDSVATLVEHYRPDQHRWPKLYLFHCPMSQVDWIQTTEEKANPYYGFKMLKCGTLKKIQ